jgi:hypothetical protein
MSVRFPRSNLVPAGMRHVARLGFSVAVAAAAAAFATPKVALAAGPAKIIKGPYLQALGPTSVEVRAELDAPVPVVVRITDGTDAGAARVVRDPTVSKMHTVVVTGLHPATHYTYVLANASTSDMGEGLLGSFTTAPTNDTKDPFTFLVYGDDRTDSIAHAGIVRLILHSPTDFLLNTGDLVEDGASEANWQTFFDVEDPVIRNRNLFACVGNHELTEGAGTSYLKYFGPTTDAHTRAEADANAPSEKPKLYGSFRWASARFFLLDAMEAFDAGPERAWLDDELTRADTEDGLVWRIVVMHQSPWSSGPHGGNERALSAGIPALFAAHHVDLILAGHDHIYERGFASGLRYLISGGGGAPLYKVEQKLESTRKVESVHHVVELKVDRESIRLATRRLDGTLLEKCGFTKKLEDPNQPWDCDATPSSSHGSSGGGASSSAQASKCGCSLVGAPAQPTAPIALGLATCALAGIRLTRRRSPSRSRRGATPHPD